MEIISEVNVFREKVEKEEIIGPMICDKSKKLDKNEVAFLKKGPRLILRPELSEENHCVEIEKMLAKVLFKQWNTDEGEVLNDEEKELVARSKLVYDKKSKVVNLENLRACDYKYNKHVNIPRPESVESERANEVRRSEMLKVFDRVSAEKDREKRKCGEKQNKEKSNRSLDSNLTKSERLGMKSLQNRVKMGEIVVTETDKSKRFCILTKQQYERSGEKHTKNDREINSDEVPKIQKTVNDHVDWLTEIFKIGEKWNQHERIKQSMKECSESVAPLYLLVKDHKGWHESDGVPPPSRPVC